MDGFSLPDRHEDDASQNVALHTIRLRTINVTIGISTRSTPSVADDVSPMII
jgi:hypothetical protein